jgi:hypothetical protein
MTETHMDAYQVPCIAFEGSRRIASGELGEVALRSKEVIERGELAPVLIFNSDSSELIEVDFRGTPWQVLERLSDLKVEATPTEPNILPTVTTPRGRGRPKLGVVAREVTLLPRHWHWLNGQPGGASVALRRLVDEAKRAHAGKDRVRQAQESTYRFMNAMAGDQIGFEEATRALFAGNQERFEEMIESWPPDVREHTSKLAGEAFRVGSTTVGTLDGER